MSEGNRVNNEDNHMVRLNMSVLLTTIPQRLLNLAGGTRETTVNKNSSPHAKNNQGSTHTGNLFSIYSVKTRERTSNCENFCSWSAMARLNSSRFREPSPSRSDALNIFSAPCSISLFENS